MITFPLTVFLKSDGQMFFFPPNSDLMNAQTWKGKETHELLEEQAGKLFQGWG